MQDLVALLVLWQLRPAEAGSRGKQTYHHEGAWWRSALSGQRARCGRRRGSCM